eukprot:2649934-Rhodomonas_salina.1
MGLGERLTTAAPQACGGCAHASHSPQQPRQCLAQGLSPRPSPRLRLRCEREGPTEAAASQTRGTQAGEGGP